MTEVRPAGGRPKVAVAFGSRSAPLMQVIAAASGYCDLVWLVDSSDPLVREVGRVLRRFGTVLDTGGLSTDAIAEELGRQRPDGLVTYSDTGLLRLAEVAEVLDLPFHRPDTARALADKAVQRERLAAAGLTVPRSWPVPAGEGRDLRAVLAGIPSWPVVLKPREESGSRHCFLAAGPDEAADFLLGLGDARMEMVAEEYLASDPSRPTGPFADYVSVESLVSWGTVSHLAVTGRFPQAPVFRETGFFIPAAVTAEEQKELFAVTDEALGALGIRHGATHTEIKFTPDGPRVIEVNGRLGGGIPDMLSVSCGYDVLVDTLRVAAGEPVKLAGPPPTDRIGFRIFHQPPQMIGAVRSVGGLDRLEKHRLVRSVSMHLGPGSPIDWRNGTRNFVLAVVGSAADCAELLEAEQLVKEAPVVEYEVVG